MNLIMNLKHIAPARTPKILLTGFGPFHDVLDNPTGALMAHFQKHPFRNVLMKTMILDVTFGNSVQPVIKEINRYQPDYIYSFGLMGSADKINIESRAINLSEGIDNDNEERHKDPVIEKGPLFYHASVSIRKILKSLQDVNISARINQKPSTFVCNHLFYSLLNFVEQNHLPMKVGFIHVPNVFTENKKTRVNTYAISDPKYKKTAISMRMLVEAAKNIIEATIQGYQPKP